MNKKIDAKDLGIEDDQLNENSIHDKINIEILIFRQILATSQAASQDESIFTANIRVLLSMIPATKRDEIQQRTDEYTSTTTRWDYKMFCGVPLGTPEEPINGSPRIVEEEATDWHLLFEIILHALEELGITWKRENVTVEVGGLEDKESAKIKPTPVFSNTPTQQDEPNISYPTTTPAKTKNLPTCGICGKHVAVDTGMHFKHIQIHLACLDRAKIEWANLEKGIRKNQ